MKSRFLMLAAAVTLFAALAVPVGLVAQDKAQSCEDYFERALRLSADLKHRAEFRIRIGTLVNGKIRGEELFGAGGIARGERVGTLEGTANFHWVERRRNTEEGAAAFRLVRREKVRLLFYRERNRVFIRFTGGREPILLEPRCSGGLMYTNSPHNHGGAQVSVINFPFPLQLRCCDNAVLTQHNDLGRTGAYLSETSLTPQALKGRGLSKFLFLFAWDVDGQVYAQPLYLPDVKMQDGTHHNVLYVATTTNRVYAFDIDNSWNTGALWNIQLGVPADPPGGWNVIFPKVGITSTPVIDIDKGVMYLVAKTVPDAQNRVLTDKIFAVDVSSGKVFDSATVAASVNGPNGPIVFDASLQKNRPGLLLLNGRIYVGYGELNSEGNKSGPNFHGWIFSFDAANLGTPPVVLNTSPNYTYAGIWQSGNAPASDGTYIYVNTGNGSIEGQSDFQSGQLGDSVLKLTADLQVAQSYTPPNVKCLDTCDLDLGSAGPVLFPNSDTLLSGAKEGIFYVFSRQDISKLSQCAFRAADQPFFTNKNQAPYCSVNTDQNGCETPDSTKYCGGNSGVSWLDIARGYSNIHGSPVVLQTGPGEYQVYVWAEENFLKMFKYSGGQLLHNPTVAQGADAQAPPDSMPGGILSLSANPQGKNAIVWGTVAKDCTQPAPDNANCDTYANATVDASAQGAIDASIPGRFVAFEANTLKEIWSDPNVGFFAKFNPPTIADGKVFVANFGSLTDNCAGNYQQGNPQKACGQVRVYGLWDLQIKIPIELVRWPYLWIDPGPLKPAPARLGD